MTSLMSDGLRRASCPAEDDVLAFAQGRLGPPAAARIEAHLDACEECVHAVAEAAAYLSQDAAASTATLPEAASRPRPHDRIGRFVVESVLGAGGAAVVYAARDPQLERRVAVKVLRSHTDETSAERLLREAKAMAQLSHPNVVTIYEAGVFGDAGDVFIAMELVPGRTLAAWLREAAPSWLAVLDRFLAAGRGLAAAHEVGIVHRDFKPSNVLVGDDGRVRVGDFGLARAAEGAPSDLVAGPPLDGASVASERLASAWASLTQTGTLLGTPSFMSPEQFEGDAATAKSDQFSFCVALFRALFDRPPFAGETIRELAREVRLGRVQRPPRGVVPAAVTAAVLRGLSSDAEQRHPSMHALLAELERGRRPRSRSARWIALGSAVAIIVAGTVAAALLVSERSGETREPRAELVPAATQPRAEPARSTEPAEVDDGVPSEAPRENAEQPTAEQRGSKRRARRSDRVRPDVPPHNSELRRPAFLQDTQR
jgi:eukaryotic-like serine/threonine-protein kinase